MRAAVVIALAAASTAVAQPSPVREAERLAAAALATADARPAEALASARRALALTAEFLPTAFVRAGRKGEVVEDEYRAARAEYRRHRAAVYEAMGAALAAGGSHEAAVRYLRRALLLAPDDARAGRLAAALLAVGRPRDALAVLHDRGRAGGGFAPALLPLLERAVDADGRPSAQVEIDRARLSALPARGLDVRDGPVRLPGATRLSTGGPLRLEAAPVVFYLPEGSCAKCSADLETLKRVLPAGTAAALVPADPDEDHALRQVVQLYRYPWPVVLGRGVADGLGGAEDEVVVVGRRGLVAVTVRPPYETALADVVKILARTDLAETPPRPAWTRRPVDRAPLPSPPGLTPEGFAPGDEPSPEFDRAVEAFRAGRHAEALRRFETLAAAGDGRLLPPEARLNRAIVLGATGRRDEARRIVLRIGDARIEDAADQVLDRIGATRG
jgi:tetratricopeptide (TPR) repeat protein